MNTTLRRRTTLALTLAASTASAQQAAPASSGTDHAAVVGHWGATWFAPVSLATLNGSFQNANQIIGQTTVTPIGARYWANAGMGYDLGVGLLYSGGSSEVKAGATTTTTDAPSAFGLVLHGGLPLALSTGKHYSFLVIPEANLGFASSSVKRGNDDVSVSGFRLDLGARAGAEVHFGFMDLPQLSLQATVGAALAFDRAGQKVGDNEASVSATTLGTSVQNEPWSIFRSNVAAIYYF
jgi:hypothetical protein